MDIKKLEDQLKIDEGCKYEIYLDSKGFPTCGIGHLIIKKDPEYKMPLGTKITSQRVDELFAIDVQSCIKGCKQCFADFDKFPEELQQILANMMFNLGYTRFLAFRKLIVAINHRDYKTAAAEMLNSAWFSQVKSRAKRLYNRMIALSQCSLSNATI